MRKAPRVSDPASVMSVGFPLQAGDVAVERQMVADELPGLAVCRWTDHHPVGRTVVGVDVLLDAHDLPALLDERPQLLQDRIVAPTRHRSSSFYVSSYVSKARRISRASAAAPSGSPLSTRFMMALPTITPSATLAAAAACSPLEIPMPSRTGSRVCGRMRTTTASAAPPRVACSPVTPRRDTAYTKPPEPLDRTAARSSGVVGAIICTSAIPRWASSARSAADSSKGRSGTIIPVAPAWCSAS